MAAITCFGFVDGEAYQHQERTRIPSALTHARGSSRYVRRVMVGSMLWLIIPELCLFRNRIHKTQEYLQSDLGGCYLVQF